MAFAAKPYWLIPIVLWNDECHIIYSIHNVDRSIRALCQLCVCVWICFAGLVQLFDSSIIVLLLFLGFGTNFILYMIDTQIACVHVLPGAMKIVDSIRIRIEKSHRRVEKKVAIIWSEKKCSINFPIKMTILRGQCNAKKETTKWNIE